MAIFPKNKLCLVYYTIFIHCKRKLQCFMSPFIFFDAPKTSPNTVEQDGKEQKPSYFVLIESRCNRSNLTFFYSKRIVQRLLLVTCSIHNDLPANVPAYTVLYANDITLFTRHKIEGAEVNLLTSNIGLVQRIKLVLNQTKTNHVLFSLRILQNNLTEEEIPNFRACL